MRQSFGEEEEVVITLNVKGLYRCKHVYVAVIGYGEHCLQSKSTPAGLLRSETTGGGGGLTSVMYVWFVSRATQARVG